MYEIKKKERKHELTQHGQSKSIGIKVVFFSCKSIYKTDYFLYNKKREQTKETNYREKENIEREREKYRITKQIDVETRTLIIKFSWFFFV